MNSNIANNLASLYSQDYNLWLDKNIEKLRERSFLEIDIENLIEELADMGKSQKLALKSNLRILLMHLLKYKYQPEKRSNSWRFTIVEHRQRLEDALEASPSLQPFLQEVFAECHSKARKLASVETGLLLSAFLKDCPFSIQEVLDTDYLPSED